MSNVTNASEARESATEAAPNPASLSYRCLDVTFRRAVPGYRLSGNAGQCEFPCFWRT